MSVIAKSENEQCLAFSSKNGPRRCRLEKRPGHKTCNIHRNYYKDWCERNVPADKWNFLTHRQQEEYRFQISRGLVEIPAEQIVLLRPSQLDYYTLFMRYTDYSPTINMRCLTEYTFLRSELNQSIEEYMLKDVETCYIIFKNIILRSIIICQESQSITMQTVEKFLSRPECKQLLFSAKLSTLFEVFQQFIYIYAPEWTELYDSYEIYKKDGLIQSHLHNAFSVHVAAIKKYCAIYKEELIAAAWKPSRIQKWLALGFDPFVDM